MYNTKEGKSCVIYIRVSSERQVKGYSLDGQKHYLAECAERRGMTVLDTYVEEGKSGKSIEGRTEFQRMLDDIQSGKVHTDYVLVFKLSRFGRNARDVLNSLEFIMKYGVHLMCVEDGLDSSTSMGKMMITILGAVAELERENIIAQSLLGREEKAKSGGWNGTLMLDGSFIPGKPGIVRSRLPVAYNPDAPKPEQWLSFLDGLLYPEDIVTLQEFIGYCLIPCNKGQRMMVIKGNGGEGKSQIGAVLGAMFGSNMKDGSIRKISENRFARADLEHILLCVDDDMRMEALRQTNYVKSIVTAQGKMDLERKGKQSYQGWMFARLLAFSNGDLQALYDRSDGFYRRQLVLTTKEKPADRIDDPDLAEKMKTEVEGIFLWAFEGLQRLVRNNFKFTESQRTKENREAVKRDNNNVYDFLESDGYIRLKADMSISSKELYAIYRMWCDENNLMPLKSRSFSDSVIACQSKYNLEHCNTVTNPAGRRVWGFMGIEAVARPHINEFSDASQCTYVPEDWRN